MNYPKLNALDQRRDVVSVFAGYDHRLVGRDGAFYDTKNLTTERYPLLATRRRRGVVSTLADPGGLIEKDALAYVDDGTLYYNGLATALTGLSAGEKQLVSMGAYIVIFPDKMYYNTKNGTDYGSLDASYTSSGDVVYSLCRADGTAYGSVQVGGDEPETGSVELWISTAGGVDVAMSWSASYGGWVQLDTVYTKLTFTSQGAVPAAFAEGDGVTISGAALDDYNGEKILYAVGGSGASGSLQSDWIVLVGLLGSAYLENGYTQTTGAVKLERKAPDMDFVCEAQNRLWGCYYGIKDGETVNEIYCCALGDFRNWRQYRGLSTDSWTAGVGSDGVWTGAANYLGSPVFFKENRIHEVGVSSVGAHTLRETVCRGVQKGSHKSLVVVNETLFYKSRTDVCAWQGGFPQGVSEALGDVLYSSAVGGAFGGRYYLSMKVEPVDGGALAGSAIPGNAYVDNSWHLFVYDIERSLWIREDALHVLQFAKVDGELYAIDAETKQLRALIGTTGTVESGFDWSAETGILYYVQNVRGQGATPVRYVSRFHIRLKMAQGASAALYIQYDSSGAWVESGSITQTGIGTVTLPVRPRRCDHFRVKLAGSGETEILSVTRILERGSDVVR